MTAAVPSTALAAIQPAVTGAGRLAVAGFVAGYRGLTREACALDLRQFATWCRARSLALFSVRRAGIGSFARDLEAKGRARAVTRRLCATAGFCKFAVEEEFLEHSPAACVRRPRAGYESHAVALDRSELGALLVTAGPGSAAWACADQYRAAGVPACRKVPPWHSVRLRPGIRVPGGAAATARSSRFRPAAMQPPALAPGGP